MAGWFPDRRQVLLVPELGFLAQPKGVGTACRSVPR